MWKKWDQNAHFISFCHWVNRSRSQWPLKRHLRYKWSTVRGCDKVSRYPPLIPHVLGYISLLSSPHSADTTCLRAQSLFHSFHFSPRSRVPSCSPAVPRTQSFALWLTGLQHRSYISGVIQWRFFNGRIHGALFNHCDTFCKYIYTLYILYIQSFAN